MNDAAILFQLKRIADALDAIAAASRARQARSNADLQARLDALITRFIGAADRFKRYERQAEKRRLVRAEDRAAWEQAEQDTIDLVEEIEQLIQAHPHLDRSRYTQYLWRQRQEEVRS